MRYTKKDVLALVLAITLIGIVLKSGVTMKKDNLQLQITNEDIVYNSGKVLAEPHEGNSHGQRWQEMAEPQERNSHGQRWQEMEELHEWNSHGQRWQEMAEPHERNSHGQRWQEMLSFLAFDVLNQCDRVFSPSLNIDYTGVLAPYYSLIEEHDKLIYETSMKLNVSKCLTGYSAKYKAETYIMLSLLRLPFVTTVCETGFNAGHSALLWLSQNPDVQVYSFDLGQMYCAKPMAEHLSQKYPGRLTVTWGNSTETLPEFIRRHPSINCDLIVIDGGHTYEVAKTDRDNFRKMVRSDDNIVFFDNHPAIGYLKKDLGRVWEEALRQGDIHEFFRCHYPGFKQGFTFGKYVI